MKTTSLKRKLILFKITSWVGIILTIVNWILFCFFLAFDVIWKNKPGFCWLSWLGIIVVLSLTTLLLDDKFRDIKRKYFKVLSEQKIRIETQNVYKSK